MGNQSPVYMLGAELALDHVFLTAKLLCVIVELCGGGLTLHYSPLFVRHVCARPQQVIYQ